MSEAEADSPDRWEGPRNAKWVARRKHFFVVSNAGRPVFSQFGDEQRLADFMGAVVGILSFINSCRNDELRWVEAGEHKWVFRTRGALVLFCVSRTGEPPSALGLQLDYLHGQILTIVTGGIQRCFEQKASFDLSGLLRGTGPVTTGLFRWLTSSFTYMLNRLPVFVMPQRDRTTISDAFASTYTSLLLKNQPVPLFGLLLHKREVVCSLQPSSGGLSPRDTLLLANLVLTSESFRAGESWAPVCMPDFNPAGFLYGYICFLAPDTPFVLLTGSSDAFFGMQSFRESLEATLKQLHWPEQLSASFDTSQCCVPGLLHLVVCYHEVEQFAVIRADEDWWQACGAGVTRDYLKAMLRICEKSSICEWLVIGNQWATYAVREAEVDIYATFDPSLSPGCIAERAQGIVDWVAIEARSLTIVDPIVIDSE